MNTTMDAFVRSLLVGHIDAASKRIKQGNLSKLDWLNIKADLLAGLNSIDHCIDYGSPGAGLDMRLGKCRPVNTENE